MVQRYNSIVILTGAGISAESGIKTFRASDGLWESHRIEDVASPRGFAVDPELVHRFYNMRRRQLVSPAIRPNEGHEALARLQESFPGQVLIVTQNIDNLHKRAGSKNIIHMHGELLKMHCSASGKIYPIRGDIGILDRCDCCDSAGTLRPHVVWYGEMPLAMDKIYHALENCDLFLSIGTSGNVYPAAGFVRVACGGGAHSVELNLEPSEVESAFAEKLYGPATQVVPAFVDRILEVASVV
ncbi:MAG: Sir2 family NAD+-dependent deacetylase [Pseudomonadota bacterium]